MPYYLGGKGSYSGYKWQDLAHESQDGWMKIFSVRNNLILNIDNNFAIRIIFWIWIRSFITFQKTKIKISSMVQILHTCVHVGVMVKLSSKHKIIKIYSHH